MKVFAAAMLVASMVLAVPAMAQDKDSISDLRDKPAVQQRVTRHHVTYRRTYKSDEEEHQATEDLNRQYRGVPTPGPR